MSEEHSNNSKEAKRGRDFHVLETGKADCSSFKLEDRDVAIRSYEILPENFDLYFMENNPEYKEKMFLIRNYLEDQNLLGIIDEEFNKKIVGENESRKTIFMVTNMRNVENLGKATDNLMVNALSGTGKDHITEAVFDLLPDDEKEELIRTTPKVLAYTRNKKQDENASWKKTTLRLEDATNDVLNDDSFKVISSANPNKINKGKTINRGKVIEIEIEGKPSIVMTIAEANPKEELLRRYPVCGLDEGINQTKEILKRQAEYAKNGKSADYDSDLIKALKLLKRVKVKVPFSEKLVYLFSAENVIARTHFQRFIDYIKSSCSLHQYQRKTDEEGYFIAEPQDYEIAKMMLQKTTSNILMIPLTKIRKSILELFEAKKLQRKSVDDLDMFEEIEKLNITPEWLRKQLDWLASKTFLTKDREKRKDEADRIIPKPVFVYSYNELQKLTIPSWKDLTEVSSNASNKEITSNSSISSDTKATEVNEVKEQELQKRSLCSVCGKEGILTQDGITFYCKECGYKKFG